jgi:hypothetical protein
MPEDLNEKIQSYATEHNCTKAEAMSHFARAGIELEENGPQVPTSEDSSEEALSRIQERLEALQNLPTIEPTKTTAIVPADIRDRIQAYSSEHECSEQEALTYYARIGVQMTADQRPANVADLTELSRRLDALAKDNQAKTEQMKQMAEVLVTIRDYTKPDEVELEGELAEDVEERELSEEERQQIADEHTRKIVSDVMGDYLAKQQDAEERARAAQQPAINPWVPVLVAVIASLAIGLIVVVLTR